MSIMNTAVSGMLANSNWLSSISQNIANSNTTGYKDVGDEFYSMVDSTPGTATQVAGVTSQMVSYATLQGSIESTGTDTNMAISGSGYFVVSNSEGDIFLTRDGAFTEDAKGYLVNSGGYYLMGASTTAATASTQSVNSLSSLAKVNIANASDAASATTEGTLVYNLNSAATAVSPDGTSTSEPTNYTSMTTVTAYDAQGAAQTVNIYFTKTGSNTWEADAYDATSGDQIGTTTLDFNSSGALTSGSPLSLTEASGQTISLDLSKGTQLSSSFAVPTTTLDGSAAGTMNGITMSSTGVMSFSYSNGQSIASYIIPLATVASPDSMTLATGQAYKANSASGAIQVNNANTAGLGIIDSSSIEESSVDIATELTNMIQAQNSYEANSKAFQTGADLFDVLNKLQS